MSQLIRNVQELCDTSQMVFSRTPWLTQEIDNLAVLYAYGEVYK
jgi:hypothetical protein